MINSFREMSAVLSLVESVYKIYDPEYSDICVHYDKCLQVLGNYVEVFLASFFP